MQPIGPALPFRQVNRMGDDQINRSGFNPDEEQYGVWPFYFLVFTLCKIF